MSTGQHQILMVMSVQDHAFYLMKIFVSFNLVTLYAMYQPNTNQFNLGLYLSSLDNCQFQWELNNKNKD